MYKQSTRTHTQCGNRRITGTKVDYIAHRAGWLSLSLSLIDVHEGKALWGFLRCAKAPGMDRGMGTERSGKCARDERNVKRDVRIDAGWASKVWGEEKAKCNFSVRRFFLRLGNHLCSSQRLLNSYHCRFYLLKNVYSISFTVTARYLPRCFCSNSSRITANDKNCRTPMWG